jgi:hypothetical protein
MLNKHTHTHTVAGTMEMAADACILQLVLALVAAYGIGVSAASLPPKTSEMKRYSFRRPSADGLDCAVTSSGKKVICGLPLIPKTYKMKRYSFRMPTTGVISRFEEVVAVGESPEEFASAYYLAGIYAKVWDAWQSWRHLDRGLLRPRAP